MAARYHKFDCENFVYGIQGRVDYAILKLRDSFNELEFYNAEEQKTFEAYHEAVINELKEYSKRVGGYEFYNS